MSCTQHGGRGVLRGDLGDVACRDRVEVLAGQVGGRLGQRGQGDETEGCE